MPQTSVLQHRHRGEPDKGLFNSVIDWINPF
jgi:hypothetical protein